MLDWVDLIIRIGVGVGPGTLIEIGADGFGATDPPYPPYGHVSWHPQSGLEPLGLVVSLPGGHLALSEQVVSHVRDDAGERV
ncbi:hypothetical protein U6S58_10275 [Cutibacterium acnes]